MNDDIGRRRKIIPITPQLICELLTTGATFHVTCNEGLPIGARFVEYYYDVLSNTHYLIFESEEWEMEEEGRRFPVLQVHYTRHHSQVTP